MRKRIARWRRVSCVALLGLAAACAPEQHPKRRALVIGLDGATLAVAGPLMSAGRLPHLARLAEAGAYGPLVSALPIQSPRIWNTIATGKTPTHHGILSFTFDAPNGERRLYLSRHRKVPALWNILSHHGISVSAVNWWNTWPPEHIKGVMVSDHFFPGQLAGREALFRADGGEGGPSVSPGGWQTRATQIAEDDANPTAFDNPFLERGQLPRWAHLESLADVFETDRRVAQVAMAIAKAESPQVLMVYFPGIDRVCHSLWVGIDPPLRFPPEFRVPEIERRAARDAVESYYAYTDALVGRLLEGYDDGDLVVVLSDHGFEAHPFGDPANGQLVLSGGHESPAARDGLLIARGHGIEPSRGLDGMGIRDVTPTLLAWLGLAVGSDMDGQPARFIGTGPFAEVASYDDIPIERGATARSPVEGEIVDQLRGLGYLE